MALPSSGPLTMADIQTEFGGSNPISLSEYYAGGSYVPAGTSGTYGAVPSSGAISIRNFYGTTKATVNFINVTVTSTTNGLAAEAGYQIQSNGYDYKNQNDVYTQNIQWVTPTSVASDYEVYATIISGSLSIGSAATGSWVAVSTNPEWVRLRPTIGLSTAILSIDVRKIGTTTVLDTWSVTLNAQRNS